MVMLCFPTKHSAQCLSVCHNYIILKKNLSFKARFVLPVFILCILCVALLGICENNLQSTNL